MPVLLPHSFTHLYKHLHWHFAKELSYKSLTGRREGNTTIIHEFQTLVVSSKKFCPREVLTSSQIFKWHHYFNTVYLCHRRLSIYRRDKVTCLTHFPLKTKLSCVTDLLVCRLKVHFWGHISNLKKILWNGICCWVAKLCLTLSDLMNCSPPGSSVHRILQARTLNGLLFPTPGDLPNPGIRLVSPALAGRFFTAEPPRKPCDFSAVLKVLQPRKTGLCLGQGSRFLRPLNSSTPGLLPAGLCLRRTPHFNQEGARQTVRVPRK